MSFVLNWYTPTKTVPVATRRPHLQMVPMTGNLCGER